VKVARHGFAGAYVPPSMGPDPAVSRPDDPVRGVHGFGVVVARARPGRLVGAIPRAGQSIMVPSGSRQPAGLAGSWNGACGYHNKSSGWGVSVGPR
jgi:hypothetical protein